MSGPSCASLLTFWRASVCSPSCSCAGSARACAGLDRARASSRLGVPLLGALTPLAIPTVPPPVWLWDGEVTLTPLNARHPAAQGSEVWLLRARNGEQLLPLAAFEHDGSWVGRDAGELVAPSGVTAPVRWRGWVHGALTLELLMHPWSGRVQVRVGERVEELDLYAETARAYTLRLTPPPSPAVRVTQGVLWLADVVSGGVLLTATLLFLATRSPEASREARAASPLLLRWSVLPGVLVWTVALLVFFPGLMSSDSVDQWRQLLRGQYHDAHPAAHTLTMWLITRVWLSPAAVALVQIGMLALAFGIAVRELALAGVGRGVQGLLIGVFALSPVNAMMVITLWKDIWYAIAMLFLFGMLLRVWRTDGAWLSAWQAQVGFGVALAALALCRHNGAPVALLTLPALLLVGRTSRLRQVVAIGSIALALFVAVKGGVYRLVDVQPVPAWFSRQMLLHHLGAYVVEGRLEDSEAALAAGFRSLEEWRRYYSCYNATRLLYASGRNFAFFDVHIADFTALWLRLVVRDPMVLVRHQVCLTSLIWRVTMPEDGYIATWPHKLIWEGGRDIGLAPASMVPDVQRAVMAWLTTLERRELVWLVWRPALPLYLTVFSVAVVCVRHRSWRPAGLAAPTAANSLVWMLLLTVQDARFQYGVYVISLLAIGLLFIPSRRGNEAGESISGDRRELEGPSEQAAGVEQGAPQEAPASPRI